MQDLVTIQFGNVLHLSRVTRESKDIGTLLRMLIVALSCCFLYFVAFGALQHSYIVQGAFTPVEKAIHIILVLFALVVCLFVARVVLSCIGAVVAIQNDWWREN